METISLIRAILLFGTVLLILLAGDSVTDRVRSTWGSWAVNALKILLLCQGLAFLASLVLGETDVENLVESSIYFDLIGLGGYTLVFQAERWNATRGLTFYARQLVEFVALLIGMGIATLVANFFNHQFYETGYLWELEGLFSFLDVIFMTGVALAGILVGSVRMFYNVKLYAEQQARAAKELEVVRLREQAVTAQLQSIQARINPHFLYNALGAIAGLVHTDPDRAELMTLALSRLFRASLAANGEPMATVRQEIDLIQMYLDIEKARFGERLECCIQVDPAALDEPMPRFLLQPLVENAIKHGAVHRFDTSHVGVRVQKDDGDLRIAVSDNGPAFPDDLMGGVGWQSVQDSLALLYPERHDIRLVNGSDKQVRITLRNEA